MIAAEVQPGTGNFLFTGCRNNGRHSLRRTLHPPVLYSAGGRLNRVNHCIRILIGIKVVNLKA